MIEKAKSGSIRQVEQYEPSQLDVCHFLSSPASHDAFAEQNKVKRQGEAGSVDVISTHCAHVFLGPAYAFKIKRAVTYSYLDMATLDQRKALCLRELELNQPVLPDIYLKVFSVTRDKKGRLAFNGDGELLEWVICMRRFDEACVLDKMAGAGTLDQALAKSLGRSIVDYHQQLPAEQVQDGYARIAEVVHELIDELNLLDKIFSAGNLRAFCDEGLRARDAAHDVLNNRACAGYVRRCHGDLHLRNLLLHHGRPVPFDALEFDERMATTDTLYDLAFLLMDLAHRGMHAEASIVLNEYLLHSDEEDVKGLAAMPLFLFCRAAIKAMTSAQSATHGVAKADLLANEARQYLQQALSYLSPLNPVVIAIGGMSGCGKSTISAELPTQVAPSPGALLLRSDSERKAALHIPETQTLPNEHYTAEASASNYARMMRKLDNALVAGYPVVLDAVFLSEAQRIDVEKMAQKHGTPFYGVWLQAPAALLQQRLDKRNTNPESDASDATAAVLEKQLKRPVGELSWHQVDASGDIQHTLDAVLEIIPLPAK